MIPAPLFLKANECVIVRKILLVGGEVLPPSLYPSPFPPVVQVSGIKPFQKDQQLSSANTPSACLKSHPSSELYHDLQPRNVIFVDAIAP